MKLPIMMTASILFCTSVHGAPLWDEGVNGDFSNVSATPTSLSALSPGTYEVLGSLQTSSDPYDTFSFNIPSGDILSAFFVREVASAPTLNLSPLSLRRGGTGTDPVIEFGLWPSLQAPGLDLLQISSQPGPQPPGIYTFTAGPPVAPPQEDTLTTYRLEIQVTAAAVPEPATLTLLGLAFAAIGLAKRRKMH